MFPHHDNELAQSEVRDRYNSPFPVCLIALLGVSRVSTMGQLFLAYWSPAYRGVEDEQVIKELHHDRRESYREGCSTANREACTRQDALNRYSARQLRLAFLLQPWSARMDFKTELIADVKTKEETLDVCLRNSSYVIKLIGSPQNFFTNIRARIAQTGVRGPSTDGRHHFDGPEKRLMDTCDACILATQVLTSFC